MLILFGFCSSILFCLLSDIMSYQIKRTPYFRRIFNNSRRNGQLQRLREEYERIQEFNDRTIELKMRQVRLKRLFREIEDINESPSTSNHQHQHHAMSMVPMSPEAQLEQQRRLRLEALSVPASLARRCHGVMRSSLKMALVFICAVNCALRQNACRGCSTTGGAGTTSTCGTTHQLWECAISFQYQTDCAASSATRGYRFIAVCHR